MKASLLGLALLGAAVLAAPVASAADDETARLERWRALQPEFFGDRATVDSGGQVALEAPPRALDAALVPVTVTVADGLAPTALYVVVDDNPGPLAARVTFGPAGDPHLLKLRVRVNQYTFMHAVAETADGRLLETAKFVKAAGGCSAPVGAGEAEALADIGRMKLRLAGAVVPGQPVEAQLMIRHPNFNGMQMDQLTRMYTPARYIQEIDVTYNGEKVFHLAGDISLSTDPVIGFAFIPDDSALPGEMRVVVRDSDDTVFEERFDIPAHGS